MIGSASDPTHRDHGGVAPRWVHVQVPDAPDVETLILVGDQLLKVPALRLLIIVAQHAAALDHEARAGRQVVELLEDGVHQRAADRGPADRLEDAVQLAQGQVRVDAALSYLTQGDRGSEVRTTERLLATKRNGSGNLFAQASI